MKFCGIPSSLALGVGALSGRGAGDASALSPGPSGEHCPVGFLALRPSNGRGPSDDESVHATSFAYITFLRFRERKLRERE